MNSKKQIRLHFIEVVICGHDFIHVSTVPFILGTCVAHVHSEILFPAGAAEEVEGEVGAALPFEPDVHVGAGAVVTLPRSTLPAAWVSALYVIVELQSEGVAQLTLHHLTVFFPGLKEGLQHGS